MKISIEYSYHEIKELIRKDLKDQLEEVPDDDSLIIEINDSGCATAKFNINEVAMSA